MGTADWHQQLQVDFRFVQGITILIYRALLIISVECARMRVRVPVYG